MSPFKAVLAKTIGGGCAKSCSSSEVTMVASALEYSFIMNIDWPFVVFLDVARSCRPWHIVYMYMPIRLVIMPLAPPDDS